MVETKCIKRPPFGIIKIVLNSYCQLIRTVTPNKEEVSWQKIIATQVKILIHIRVRTAQTAILKMQMTAMAEKMIMMSQTDINRYCEQ